MLMYTGHRHKDTDTDTDTQGHTQTLTNRQRMVNTSANWKVRVTVVVSPQLLCQEHPKTPSHTISKTMFRMVPVQNCRVDEDRRHHTERV